MTKIAGYERYTLDVTEGWVLGAERTNALFWEIQSRETLWLGLEDLCTRVSGLQESGIVKTNPFNPLFLDDGQPKMAGDVPTALIVCWFQWFAVSASNFVGLTWRLARDADLTSVSRRKYQEQVMPEVVHWRNKVAAHLAITGPYEEDKGAMESLCVANHLTAQRGALQIAGLELHSQKVGEQATHAAIEGWTLTRVQAQLRDRYRPDAER